MNEICYVTHGDVILCSLLSHQAFDLILFQAYIVWVRGGGLCLPILTSMHAHKHQHSFIVVDADARVEPLLLPSDNCIYTTCSVHDILAMKCPQLERIE